MRLAAPDGFGAPLLVDCIDAFHQRHPGVRFDLLLDNGHTDVVASQVDIIVRLAIDLEDSSLVVRRLGQTPLALYASPAYLAAHGAPAELEELSQHRCLHLGGARHGSGWPVQTEAGMRNLRFDWALSTNQTSTYREAVAGGFGGGHAARCDGRGAAAGGALAARAAAGAAAGGRHLRPVP